MPKYTQKKNRPASLYLLVTLLLLLSLPCPLPAGDKESQRVWVGLDLFPSILAADKDIASKVGPDGNLLLLLHYVENKEAVLKMAAHLRTIGTIRNIPIRIELSNTHPLESHPHNPVAGVFIAQKNNTRLHDLILFGEEHHVIIFSPFTGDVEAGVTGGIIIDDRIRPYINRETLRNSVIRLKPFFLRIAKAYD